MFLPFFLNILPGVLPPEFSPTIFFDTVPSFPPEEIFRQQYPVDEAAWAYLLKSGIDVQREAAVSSEALPFGEIPGGYRVPMICQC